MEKNWFLLQFLDDVIRDAIILSTIFGLILKLIGTKTLCIPSKELFIELKTKTYHLISNFPEQIQISFGAMHLYVV